MCLYIQGELDDMRWWIWVSSWIDKHGHQYWDGDDEYSKRNKNRNRIRKEAETNPHLNTCGKKRKTEERKNEKEDNLNLDKVQWIEQHIEIRKWNRAHYCTSNRIWRRSADIIPHNLNPTTWLSMPWRSLSMEGWSWIDLIFSRLHYLLRGCCMHVDSTRTQKRSLYLHLLHAIYRTNSEEFGEADHFKVR